MLSSETAVCLMPSTQRPLSMLGLQLFRDDNVSGYDNKTAKYVAAVSYIHKCHCDTFGIQRRSLRLSYTIYSAYIYWAYDVIKESRLHYALCLTRPLSMLGLQLPRGNNVSDDDYKAAK